MSVTFISFWPFWLRILENSACPCDTVYPKKYAHGFCFAVLCCGYTLTDFPISIRLTSLALRQSNDCPSASKSTLMNMDRYFMWIHYERLHNHNKAKHNKTVCIFLGIYCISDLGQRFGLKSPSLHQTCIPGFSRLVLQVHLHPQGHFAYFDSEFGEIWLVRAITYYRFGLQSPHQINPKHASCYTRWNKLETEVFDLDLQGHFYF